MIKKLLASFIVIAFFGLCADGAVRLHGGGITGTPGTLGTGLNFAAINQAIVKPAASLQFSGPFTVSFLVKTTILSTVHYPTFIDGSFIGLGGPGYVVSDRTPDSYDVSLITNGDLCSQGTSACMSDLLLNDGLNHLITAEWDGTLCRIYLSDATHNASLMGLGGCSFTPGTSYNILGNNSTAFTLTDIRLCSSLQSPANISTLWGYYAAGLTPPTGVTLGCTLAAYYPLSSSTIHLTGSPLGGTLDDVSGNGNTAYVDTTPPTVAWSTPTNGATVSGASVTATCTASDNVGVASVQLLLDGGNYGAPLTSGPYTTTINTTAYIDGTYTLGCQASDIQGNTAIANISVTFSNGISATQYEIATAGSDSNNCVSAPCATLAHIQSAITFRPGDSLAINGGDTISGCFKFIPTNVPSGGLPGLRVTLKSYATGVGTISSNCTGAGTAAVTIDGVNGITVNGVALTNGSTTPLGVLIQNDFISFMSGVTVENASITGFVNTPLNNAEIGIYGFSLNGNCGALDSISILNNTLSGASGNTSPDSFGIDGFGCGENITNVTDQGNLVLNLGATAGANANSVGIECGGINGCTVQDNVVHDLNINNTGCGGGGGIESFQANAVTFQFNEVYKVKRSGGCDAIGEDFDGNTTNSIGQYDYVHNNDGPAYLLLSTTGAWGPNTLRYSISENDAQQIFDTSGQDTVNPGIIGGTWNGVNIYNVTVWQGETNGQRAPAIGSGSGGGPGGAGITANNIFAVSVDGIGNLDFAFFGHLVGYGFNMYNDNYFSISAGGFFFHADGNALASLAAVQAYVPGGETNATIASPGITSGGAGGNCNSTSGPQPCPSAYHQTGLLTAGAVLTGSPYNLPSVGTRDYYGNAIGGSGQYSIGAFQ